MKHSIILCTGGARSGKSEFAESYVLAQQGEKGYVATSQIFDDEMKDRIQKHQERRGVMWHNYEVPLHLHEQWSQIADTCDVVLIDCVTMWVTNGLMAMGDLKNQDDANRFEAFMLEEIENLLKAIEQTDTTVIFVTNELGLGIVPDNKMSRFFRDVAGKVNRRLATIADHVYMTISGITIDIKALEVHVNG